MQVWLHGFYNVLVCKARDSRAVMDASTPESNARQILTQIPSSWTLKTCDRSLTQGLGKAKLKNCQVLGFDCPVQVQREL